MLGGGEMRNYFIVLFLLFFLSGCTNNADYKLKVLDDSIEEEIYISTDDIDNDKASYLNEIFNFSSRDNKWQIDSELVNHLRNEEIIIASDNKKNAHTKEINNDKIKLSYVYNDNYGNSKIFSSCFGDNYYDSTDDYYVLKGYNQFKCLYKDTVKVVIETDYRVIESNADEIDGNKYIWNFNDSNYLVHDMYIQVSKKYMAKSVINWKFYLIGFVIVLGFAYLILKFKKIDFVSNNEV